MSAASEDEFPIGAVIGGRWRVTEVVRGGPDRGQLRAVRDWGVLVTIGPPQRQPVARVAESLALLSPRIEPLLWAGLVEGEGVAYDALVEREPDGVDLTRWVGTLDAALAVARELAATVREAHDRGLVLGGLRPELCYASADRLTGVVPRAERFWLGATERSYGVPPCFDEVYMAPEQLALRPPGPPADVFSLGATLARLLTGRPPFPGATMLERMSAAMHGRHAPLDGAGRASAVLAAAMRREPAERPLIEDVCSALA